MNYLLLETHGNYAYVLRCIPNSFIFKGTYLFIYGVNQFTIVIYNIAV